MIDVSRFNCIGEMLLEFTLTHQPQVALIETDRNKENGRWTYTDLRHEAERVAALLQHHGFERGHRCAILMSNQSKWIFSATGAFWVGGVIIPIDYKLTAQEQLHLLNHCKPKTLIIEWPLWKRFQGLDLTCLWNTTVLVTEAPQNENLWQGIPWETPDPQSYQFVSRLGEDIACIVYSSGTGGTPKGCMLTHNNYLAQAQALGRLFPIESKDRYFSILPTNHAIDFMCGFLLPLAFGAAIVHQRTLRPEFLISTMKTYGISHMALVPMLLKAFEKEMRKKLGEQPFYKRKFVQTFIQLNALLTKRKPNHALSKKILKPIHAVFGGKLRMIFAGGAFVNSNTAEFFYSLGFPVVIGYGLTEAGTVLTVNDLKPFRSDTVGKVIPGTSLTLNNVNPNGEGEIWVKGPTVMKGYLDAPDLTQETIVDGWLRTGDVGIMDSYGHIKLIGRVKNMIVTEGGKNIYPEDVETMFDHVEAFSEQCVFAANFLWPTGKLAQDELCIVIRPKDHVSMETVKECLQERNRRLHEHKRISAFVIWNQEFPRTASMKIKRNLLAQELTTHMDRTSALQVL